MRCGIYLHAEGGIYLSVIELLDEFYEEYQDMIAPEQYEAAKGDSYYFLVLIKLALYHEEQEKVDK